MPASQARHPRLLRPVLACFTGIVWLCTTASTPAAAPTPGDIEFFEKKVRPLLVAHCNECHSGDEPESQLNMESLSGLLAGGLRGPALVPGKPDQSLLVTAIRHNEELKMPPKRKLPTTQRLILTEWVKRGAPWPNAKSNPKPNNTKRAAGGPLFTKEQKAFWAFQPLKAGSPPVNHDARWAVSPIDRFILARLEAAGLKPAPPVDSRTWIRRVSLDLTGLPPTPADTRAFLADHSPTARSRVVDRLLGSPAYGERWARHWLDVARYADSNGLDENLCYGNAFRYRDYVVRALNADLPYDQFVREQIAGDLMTADADDETRLQRIIATGFLVLGPKMLAEDDPRKMQMDIIDEQIDTIGKTFLGLTIGCARCHDHKFDPIPTADYYSLAGIFKSTKTMENFRVVAKWNETQLADPETIAAQKQHATSIETAKKQLATMTTDARQAVADRARRRAGDYLVVASSRWMIAKQLAGRKPIGGTANQKTAPGVVVREAETFDRGNAAKHNTGYGEGIGVILNGGKLPNIAEYDITVEQGGAYRIEVRVAAAMSRPCRLMVNGAVIRSDAIGHVTGTWNPDSQKWFLEGVAEFRKGTNTLVIDCPGPFPHIDKLLYAPLDGTRADASNLLGQLGQLKASIKKEDTLNGQILAQWVNHLKSSRTDKTSPLAAWHHALDAAGAALTIKPGPRIKPLVGKPLAELAAGYRSLLADTDTAWRHQLKDTNGRSKSLDDPELESARRLLYDPKGPFAVSKQLDSAFDKATLDRIKTQKEQIAKLTKSKPALPLAMAVIDGKAEDLKVHIRGSYLTLGNDAPRRFPRILAGESQPTIPKTTSGRMELARWMTSASNPLTPRIMANRIWRWHFGHGIVRSTDNFGSLGERPTHPRLLDWLAQELRRRNWSLKAMHKEIVLSSTYGMSTRFDERAAAADPENRLQWRMDRRRLTAEEVRDALLQVGGVLDRRLGGSLMTVNNRAYVTGTGHNMKTDVYDNNRRSIYQPVVRSALFEVFQAFDFADPSLPNGDRVTTTIAPQALFLMNSVLVDNQSVTITKRILESPGDDVSRIRLLYDTLLGRPPESEEQADASTFLSQYRLAAQEDDKKNGSAKDLPAATIRAWQALCRALMASTEFVYTE